LEIATASHMIYSGATVPDWRDRPLSAPQPHTVREDIMRSTITAFALIAGLLASGPGHAEGTRSPLGTPSPSAMPRQQAPVGHRQPRPGDLQPGANPPPPAAPTPDVPPSSDPYDPSLDARLNRVLNSICRGC
jgi:hypothetical protein